MLGVLPSSSDWNFESEVHTSGHKHRRRFGLPKHHTAPSDMPRSSEERRGLSLFGSKREASNPASPLLPSFKGRKSKKENRIYSSSVHQSPLHSNTTLPSPEDLGIGPSRPRFQDATSNGRLTCTLDSNPILGDDNELHDPSFVRHNREMMSGSNDTHELSHAQTRQRRHHSSPTSTPILPCRRSSPRPSARSGSGDFVGSNAFSGLSAYGRPRSESQNQFNAGLGLQVEGSILGQDDDLLLESSSDESDDDDLFERTLRRSGSARRSLSTRADASQRLTASPRVSMTGQLSPFARSVFLHGTPQLLPTSENASVSSIDRSLFSDRESNLGELSSAPTTSCGSLCTSPRSAVAKSHLSSK